MTAWERLEARRDEILKLAARHGARNVRVFGSVARGEESEKSDFDFLVEVERGVPELEATVAKMLAEPGA